MDAHVLISLQLLTAKVAIRDDICRLQVLMARLILILRTDTALPAARHSYIPSHVKLLQPHPGPCRGQHCSIQDIRGGPCCATSKGQELWKLCLCSRHGWNMVDQLESWQLKSCDPICGPQTHTSTAKLCSDEIRYVAVLFVIPRSLSSFQGRCQPCVQRFHRHCRRARRCYQLRGQNSRVCTQLPCPQCLDWLSKSLRFSFSTIPTCQLETKL